MAVSRACCPISRSVAVLGHSDIRVLFPLDFMKFLIPSQACFPSFGIWATHPQDTPINLRPTRLTLTKFVCVIPDLHEGCPMHSPAVGASDAPPYSGFFRTSISRTQAKPKTLFF